MTGASFRDYVESVRSAVDIADVVGEAVSLRKAGNALVGLCPFHAEKTPSFRVNPERGLYYCFGCQAGGDVFSFVKAFHGIEFPEAVRLLGDRLGIPRPAPSRGGSSTREDQRRQRLFRAIAEAQGHYASQLAGPAGEPARRYLAERGLEMESATYFDLGVATASWDDLLRHLSARGFQVDELVEAGLVVPRRQGSGVYDRFRQRLVFPIRDTVGRVVSFGGRALGDEEPKYLNGPETPVYDKGRTLFRMSEEASRIRQSGRAVIVEGYFDAVSLAAAGVPGVVAVCGTALGPHHAALLRRYTDRVVLLLDGDAAGRRAVRRALGPLLSAGLSVRATFPPDGMDPDDLARAGGAGALTELLDSALDLPTFLVGEARREFDVDTVEGRVAALEMVLGHLTLLDSPVARAESIARVSDGLGIEDEMVREELRRAAKSRRSRLAPVAAGRQEASARRGLSPAEAQILRFLTEIEPADAKAADRLLADVPQESLGPLAAVLVNRWMEGRRTGELLNARQLSESVDPLDRAAVLRIAFDAQPAPDAVHARSCVDALRERHLRSRLAAVQKQIESTKDSQERESLFAQKIELARELETFRSVAGTGAVG